jgi:hypothetical protein
MEVVNMSRRLDVAPFWVHYHSGYGDTVSPVAVFAFLEVANSYSRNIAISSYSLALESDHCEWITLSAIDTRGKRMLWGGEGLETLRLLNVTNSYNEIWQKPIPAGDTQFGVLIFDTPETCDVDWGHHVRLKMTLVDSSGKAHYFTSPDFVVAADFPLDHSGSVHSPALEMAGFKVDARNAYRRIYNDPVRTISPGERGRSTVEITPDGHVGTILMTDGVFMLRNTRPKQQ